MKEVVQEEGNIKKYHFDVTGRYILRHPLFMLIKPRLLLYRKDENGKVEGDLCFLGFKKKLRLAKHKEQEWIFQFDVDIVTVDVVVRFCTEKSFEGLVDTPVGHIRFIGKKVGVCKS